MREKINGHSIQQGQDKKGETTHHLHSGQRHPLYDIDTAEKAYWVGYIFANGELQEEVDSCQLAMSTGGDKKEQHDKLPSYMLSNAITTYGDVQLWHLVSHDELLIEALQHHGMEVGTDAHMQIPPTLSFMFIKPFMIGYIDGKGTFTSSPDKITIAGPISFLKELKEVVEDEIKVNLKVHLMIDGSVLLTITKSRDILLFLHWMYGELPFGLSSHREFYQDILSAFEKIEKKKNHQKK